VRGEKEEMKKAKGDPIVMREEEQTEKIASPTKEEMEKDKNDSLQSEKW